MLTTKIKINKPNVRSEHKPETILEKKLDNNIKKVEHIDNNTIIVEHNKDKLTYSFYKYNDKTNLIGSFSINNLVNFLSENKNIIDDNLSYDIIKKYVFNIVDNNIILVSHLDSPITGNIEMLLKIHSDLTNYLNINKDIIDPNNRIKKFIFIILNTILKLSSYVSNHLGDNDTQDLKYKLLRYSVGTVYKIANIINEDINAKLVNYKDIQTNIQRFIEIKETLFSRIDDIQQTIEKQNITIQEILNKKSETEQTNNSSDYIINNINDSSISKMIGGDDSETKTSTTYQTTTQISSFIPNGSSSDTSTIKSKSKIYKIKSDSDLDSFKNQNKYTSSDSDSDDTNNEIIASISNK